MEEVGVQRMSREVDVSKLYNEIFYSWKLKILCWYHDNVWFLLNCT